MKPLPNYVEEQYLYFLSAELRLRQKLKTGLNIHFIIYIFGSFFLKAFFPLASHEKNDKQYKSFLV